MNKNYIKNSMLLCFCLLATINNIFTFPESEDMLQAFNQNDSDDQETQNERSCSFQGFKDFVKSFFAKSNDRQESCQGNRELIALIKKQNQLLEEQNKLLEENTAESKKRLEEFINQETFLSIARKHTICLFVHVVYGIIIKTLLGASCD